jgi:hypothetical protein
MIQNKGAFQVQLSRDMTYYFALAYDTGGMEDVVCSSNNLNNLHR